MGLAEGFVGLMEWLYFKIRQLICRHKYNHGWIDMVTGMPAKVCYKCDKIVVNKKLKGGIPKLDTPILSEEDVKNLDNDI